MTEYKILRGEEEKTDIAPFFKNISSRTVALRRAYFKTSRSKSTSWSGQARIFSRDWDWIEIGYHIWARIIQAYRFVRFNFYNLFALKKFNFAHLILSYLSCWEKVVGPGIFLFGQFLAHFFWFVPLFWPTFFQITRSIHCLCIETYIESVEKNHEKSTKSTHKS